MGLKSATRICKEMDGQMCGGRVIVYEDGRNVIAAKCVEGNWVIEPEFVERLAGKPKSAKKEEGNPAPNLNEPGKRAVAPNIAEQK